MRCVDEGHPHLVLHPVGRERHAVLEKRVHVLLGHHAPAHKQAVHRCVHQVRAAQVSHAELQAEVAVLQTQAGAAREDQRVTSVLGTRHLQHVLRRHVIVHTVTW